MVSWLVENELQGMKKEAGFVSRTQVIDNSWPYLRQMAAILERSLPLWGSQEARRLRSASQRTIFPVTS
jgi:hypothetical protein